MDLRHNHGSDIYAVRACHTNDGRDLVAIGGTYSVQVLLATPTSTKVIANFHIGSKITALAWSPKSTSPSTADEWALELAAASSTNNLYLLTKSRRSIEYIFMFGGGLSGHHAKINDLTYAGGEAEISCRYLASVSDDRTLLIWDLTPEHHVQSPGFSDFDDMDDTRPQPTAYAMAFPHPLVSVSSHPSTSKDLLVADSRGSVFLVDWRTDDENEAQRFHNPTVVELIEPHVLSDSATGVSKTWSASAAWRADSADIIGATYGARFALWDLAKLNGGKPTKSGISHVEGGGRFRWCPTLPEYFGISTTSQKKGAIINLHHTAYTHTSPTSFTVAKKPQFIRDFDFLATPGIPRIAAAVGKDVVIFSIGVE